MAELPSGGERRAAPAPTSAQSPWSMPASKPVTSDRLSSTCRSTSSTLRTITVSFPSAITVLSPAAATVGLGAVANAGLAAGAPAERDVSEKLTAPVGPFEHAAKTNAGTNASSFTFFILPPQTGGMRDWGRERAAPGGKRCGAHGARPGGARPARRVRGLTCVHDTWRSCLHRIGAAPSVVSQEDP